METWAIYNVQYDGKSTYINTVLSLKKMEE